MVVLLQPGGADREPVQVPWSSGAQGTGKGWLGQAGLGACSASPKPACCQTLGINLPIPCSPCCHQRRGPSLTLGQGLLSGLLAPWLQQGQSTSHAAREGCTETGTHLLQQPYRGANCCETSWRGSQSWCPPHLLPAAPIPTCPLHPEAPFPKWDLTTRMHPDRSFCPPWTCTCCLHPSSGMRTPLEPQGGRARCWLCRAQLGPRRCSGDRDSP